ncbi:MAG: hypothetical protein DI635_10485 [Pseudoxanthomonas suwonensis]|nr:MAG: hypothetical protein DI635_10485 [Pseudoxanthomonas suwonensis]
MLEEKPGALAHGIDHHLRLGIILDGAAHAIEQWSPFANTGLHLLRIHVRHGFEVTGSGSSLDTGHEQAAAGTMQAQQPDQPGTGQPKIVPRQHVDQMARAAAIAISKPPVTPMAGVRAACRDHT